jgi:hypothetical protein
MLTLSCSLAVASQERSSCLRPTGRAPRCGAFGQPGRGGRVELEGQEARASLPAVVGSGGGISRAPPTLHYKRVYDEVMQSRRGGGEVAPQFWFGRRFVVPWSAISPLCQNAQPQGVAPSTLL